MAPAVPLKKFSINSLASEAQLLIEGDGSFVITENGYLDPVQIELVKGEFEDQFHGLTAVTLTPVGPVSKPNAQPAILVRPQDTVDLDIAYKRVLIEPPDGEEISFFALVLLF